MNKVGSLFGRLLVLLIFVSPLFTFRTFADYYTTAAAREIAYQFLSEVDEVGLTWSAYAAFEAAEAKLGFQVTLSVEGVEQSFAAEELIALLEAEEMHFSAAEFITCTLQKGNKVLRLGGT